MITEIILPKLGQTMEKGTIVEWLKHEGDAVRRGDVLFTVETDKAVLEVEAQEPGFLRRILVPAGVEVPVMAVVALMSGEAAEELPAHPAAGGPEPSLAPARPQPAGSPREPGPPAEGRLFASPRARRAAREAGVDLSRVPGTGPGGRIVERDVVQAAAAPRATPMARRIAQAQGIDLATVPGSGIGGRIVKADVEAAAGPPAAEPLTGVRRITAERMAASARATARVTLVTEADATTLVEVRESLRDAVAEEWGFAPGYTDLLGLIVARALAEFPYMNARLSEDGRAIERLPHANLGIAVDTERGLVVPVIRDAAARGLRAFGTELRALLDRARAGRSSPDDLAGGTFTITNLGMYDVDAFTPVINLPEAAILGAGRIQARAVVRGGEIVARQMWTLSLAFDHRLVDGAPAARFLQRIKQLVENPYLLLG
jgi:pyruvate dehydrogenase E2 component (dihydrolipoamide acetyltransferase)